jgi:catechol 2,3-dioxygenase-like lactoylglutathione lyase family enzyme
MSLHESPLLYVFYDIAGLDAHRELLESAIGLPVIEVEAHLPHERHGVVKYDGGTLIPSINLSTPRKFHDDQSDALVTVFDVPAAFDREAVRERCAVTDTPAGEVFTDPWGHHYAFRPAADGAGPSAPVVAELRLAVDDVAESVAFYRDLLDLDVVDESPGQARIATASTDLVLERRSVGVDGRTLDRRTVLIVFYARPIQEMRETLIDRGLAFSTRRVAYSKIGGTTRFEDPSGHRFCLYEPSDDSLTWGSGQKVLAVAAGAAAR